MIERSPKYKRIGEKLVNTLPEFATIKEMGVRIAWLTSDEDKKKNHKIVCADCTKVNDRYEWCCKYDFMITVYEPNIELFSEDQIRILLEHEIRHIGIDNEGVEPVFYVAPHDIEEFWEIIDKYGLHWNE